MNAVRYYVALILVILLPPVLYYWLLIHPFVRFWRRLGPGLTYGIVCSIMALNMVSLFRIRQSLLAVEFGTNYYLTALGLLLLAASTWLGFQILHHMSILTILGLPELAPDKCPQQLIRSESMPLSATPGRSRSTWAFWKAPSLPITWPCT